MIYLELLWSFIKIGFTSFGGLSMVPLVNSEMVAHGWMTPGEVTDIVAIAEMTPGPLGMNCATFAGMRAAGFLGAIAANIGVLMPTFTLCLLAAIFFMKFKNSRLMKDIMVGVRPACFGMIVGICISMALTNYVSGTEIDATAMLIGTVDAILLIVCKMSITKVILISGGMGLVCYGIMPLLL